MREKEKKEEMLEKSRKEVEFLIILLTNMVEESSLQTWLKNP